MKIRHVFLVFLKVGGIILVFILVSFLIICWYHVRCQKCPRSLTKIGDCVDSWHLEECFQSIGCSSKICTQQLFAWFHNLDSHLKCQIPKTIYFFSTVFKQSSKAWHHIPSDGSVDLGVHKRMREWLLFSYACDTFSGKGQVDEKLIGNETIVKLWGPCLWWIFLIVGGIILVSITCSMMFFFLLDCCHLLLLKNSFLPLQFCEAA